MLRFVLLNSVFVFVLLWDLFVVLAVIVVLVVVVVVDWGGGGVTVIYVGERDGE